MTNLQKIKTANALTAKENKIYQKTLTKFSDASIYELKDRIDKNCHFWVNWHSHFNSLDDDLRPFGRYFDYVFPSIILTSLTITAYTKQWAEANAVALISASFMSGIFAAKSILKFIAYRKDIQNIALIDLLNNKKDNINNDIPLQDYNKNTKIC